MKAIVQDSYGIPDKVLNLCEIDKPTVAEGDVLIRVCASSVHPDVWHVVNGWPLILRLFGAGVFKPKNPVPGTDVSGVVEAVGEGVKTLAPGDAVFGETHLGLQWVNGGAFAEYVSVPQEALAIKPTNVTFEQAASVPTSGFIALHNLQNGKLIKSGHHVLINGAGGGVGAIALQLAKAYGASVTGVDRLEKLEMIQKLGADHVIDFTKEDFRQGDERYDLIFDVASNLTLSSCKGVLMPTGKYVVIGHDHFGTATGRFFGSLPRMIRIMLASRFVSHLKGTQAPIPKKSEVMATLKGFLEGGKLTPLIDRTYPLSKVPEAIRYLQSGKALGRIIINPRS